jgi:cyclase
MSKIRSRIIPVLLLSGKRLVKTRKFRNPVYLGDPVNTIRIFNDMEVDELILLDVCATPDERAPQFEQLQEIAAESLFPLAYGGGVRSVDDAVRIILSGFERIALNSIFATDQRMVRTICSELGSSSIIGSMDVKKRWLRGETVMVNGGNTPVSSSVVDWARRIEDLGVGEIMVNAIDHDGEMCGYNTDLVARVSQAVSVPVIACGGASSFTDFPSAIRAGAAAAAGGAVFVFKGKHRGVLIQYPSAEDRQRFS